MKALAADHKLCSALSPQKLLTFPLLLATPPPPGSPGVASRYKNMVVRRRMFSTTAGAHCVADCKDGHHVQALTCPRRGAIQELPPIHCCCMSPAQWLSSRHPRCKSPTEPKICSEERHVATLVVVMLQPPAAASDLPCWAAGLKLDHSTLAGKQGNLLCVSSQGWDIMDGQLSMSTSASHVHQACHRNPLNMCWPGGQAFGLTRQLKAAQA